MLWNHPVTLVSTPTMLDGVSEKQPTAETVTNAEHVTDLEPDVDTCQQRQRRKALSTHMKGEHVNTN